MYVIYRFLNVANGKSYVGLTKRGHETRWKENVRAARRQPKTYLQFAIRKHGEDCWEQTIIEECQTLDDAKRAEIQWIATLNTYDDGYNCTLGGDAVGEFTEEIRQKIRDAAKRRPPISDETRRRMSEAARNRPPVSKETRTKLRNLHLGRRPTRETRRKMSEAAQRRVLPPQTFEARRKRSCSMMGKNGVRVVQMTLDYDEIRTYQTISEAQCETGVKNISACCRGRRPHAGGYRWRYAEEGDI